MMKTAYLVDPRSAETIGVLGPTIRFLTPPGSNPDEPCVMRGVIPPGGFVPLHSHHAPETFFVEEGGVEALVVRAGAFEWMPARAGQIVHVPGGARHAWRNPTPEPVVTTLVSTNRIAHFFREIGAPAGANGAAPPTDDAIRHFLEVAERYGYWNATPEENAAVGLGP